MFIFAWLVANKGDPKKAKKKTKSGTNSGEERGNAVSSLMEKGGLVSSPQGPVLGGETVDTLDVFLSVARSSTGILAVNTPEHCNL